MSIFSTSGQMPVTPISKEDVLELLSSNMTFALVKDRLEIAGELKKLIEIISQMPTMPTADGKKLKRAYYPRVMVKSEWDDEPHQIGDITNELLTVAHIDGDTYLKYENNKCYLTGWSEDGYKFVGEKAHLDFDDDTEHIRFDAVWVEDE